MSENASTVLDDITAKIKNLDMNKLGAMAADMIRSHIYKGKGFEPLSPATAAYRGNGRPLLDTGNLRDSITYKAEKDSVSVGTVRPDAPLHNSGGVINAKKSWLYIPAAGTRKLQRRYGYKPGEVLAGLKAEGYSVFRIRRTVCYLPKGRNRKPRTVYYLKKSVTIPKREFFFLSDRETKQLCKEIGNEIL